MVLEIALGIVLAVIILAFLPLILSVGLILLVLAAVVILAIVFWDKLAVFLGSLVTIALLFDIPLYLKEELPRAYAPNC